MSKYGDNCKACEKCEKKNKSGSCSSWAKCEAFREWFGNAWDEIRFKAEVMKNDKSKS